MSKHNPTGIKLEVLIDHDAYYPGSVVNGKVNVTISRKVRAHAIRLRLTGKEWSIIRKDTAASGRILRDQRMTFWKDLITLEGCHKTLTRESESEGTQSQKIGRLAAELTPSFELQPGSYCYPFEFLLPPHLPPSYQRRGDEEDYAAILYFVKAYVDLPGGRSGADVIFRKFFTIVSRISMNQWKTAECSAAYAGTKVMDVSCMCFDKGKVAAQLKLAKTVWSIEDDKEIRFTLRIDNTKGEEPVEGATVQLVHHIDVHADGESESRPQYLGLEKIECVLHKGAAGSYTGRIPLAMTAGPTVYGLITSSYYTLRCEYDVPYAIDPWHEEPVKIVQSVEKNSMELVPKMNLSACGYNAMNKFNEHDYQPPEGRENEVVGAFPPGATDEAKQKLLRNTNQKAVNFPLCILTKSQKASASKSRPIDGWELPYGLEKYK